MTSETDAAKQRPCWFVGARYETAGDQTERFLRDGIWEMEQWDKPAHDRYARQVASMQPGDRIAIKSTYVRKNEIRFDNKGKPVSVMAIKAIGEITGNTGDGHRVKVNWTRLVIGGAGTRANVVAVLLMGEDVERYPPYRIGVMTEACTQTGYQPPGRRERGGIVRAWSRLSRQVHRGGGGARSPGTPPVGGAVHRMGNTESSGGWSR